MTLYDRYLKSSVVSSLMVLSALILSIRVLKYISENIFFSKRCPPGGCHMGRDGGFPDLSGLLLILVYFVVAFSVLMFLLVLKKFEDANIKYATILAVLCTASLITVVFWLSLKVFGPILTTAIS